MTTTHQVDSIEELRRLSAPAELHYGDAVEPHLWPMARDMFQLWHSLCQDAVAPRRAALSPMEIGEAMPLLCIFDVTGRDPFLMKCRLMGSAFVQAIGYDATGHFTDDYGRTELLNRRANWVCEHIRPLLITGLPLVWSPTKNYKTYDTLTLPFIGDDGAVDAILYLNQFHTP